MQFRSHRLLQSICSFLGSGMCSFGLLGFICIAICVPGAVTDGNWCCLEQTPLSTEAGKVRRLLSLIRSFWNPLKNKGIPF